MKCLLKMTTAQLVQLANIFCMKCNAAWINFDLYSKVTYIKCICKLFTTNVFCFFSYNVCSWQLKQDLRSYGYVMSPSHPGSIAMDIKYILFLASENVLF